MDDIESRIIDKYKCEKKCKSACTFFLIVVMFSLNKANSEMLTMKAILTSSLGGQIKIDGKRLPAKLPETNGLLRCIKREIKEINAEYMEQYRQGRKNM